MADRSNAVEQKDRIRATFDLRSDTWRDRYAEVSDFSNYNFLIRRGYVLDLLLRNVSSDGRFLDVGCGTGDYLPALLDRRLDVWCMDVSPAMIERVRQRFADASGAVHISEGDCEDMTYEDEFFDGIICAGVLEYLSDDTKGLLEIKRVLKAGGSAVITVPNKRSLFMMLDLSVYWLSRLIGHILEKTGMFEFVFRRRRLNRTSIHNRYAPSRFDSRLEALGFAIEDHAYCSFGSFALSKIFPLAVPFSRFCERFQRNRISSLFALNYIVKVARR